MRRDVPGPACLLPWGQPLWAGLRGCSPHAPECVRTVLEPRDSRGLHTCPASARQLPGAGLALHLHPGGLAQSPDFPTSGYRLWWGSGDVQH